MAGILFLIIFAVVCGLYLAFMLATGETLQANSRMQRITRKSSAVGYWLNIIVAAVFCAGTLLLSMLMLLGFQV
jgi:uncharacterized membrane protein YjjP (DUF1212 family)